MLLSYGSPLDTGDQPLFSIPPPALPSLSSFPELGGQEMFMWQMGCHGALTRKVHMRGDDDTGVLDPGDWCGKGRGDSDHSMVVVGGQRQAS